MTLKVKIHSLLVCITATQSMKLLLPARPADRPCCSTPPRCPKMCAASKHWNCRYNYCQEVAQVLPARRKISEFFLNATMNRPGNHLYEFGRFRLDPAEHSLLRDGQPVALRPKVFDILLVLVENSGHLVEKEELLEKVWPGQFVEEGNLNKNISMLRQALGESPASHQYIETVPKRGYRFVAKVSRLQNGDSELVVEKHARTRVVFEEEEETNGHIITDQVRQNADPSFVSASPSATVESSIAGNPNAERSTAYKVLPVGKRSKRLVALAATISVLAVSSLLLFRFIKQNRLDQSQVRLAAPFPQMKPTQLTNMGNVMAIAVSPNGQYIVYSVEDAGRQSLWLRQITTNSSQQIVQPADVSYEQLIFSSDGDYIYYAQLENPYPVMMIYRIPLLGGVPTKLVEDVGGYFALSPDNAQIGFVRDSSTREESRLMVANVDGGERQLSVRKLPERFRYPAWSPDGKVIVVSAGNFEASGAHLNVVEVKIANGNEKAITSSPWHTIECKAWLPDGSGLVMIAGDQLSRSYQRQIWYLSYPRGEAVQITNDVSSYTHLSMTADTKTLATIKSTLVANIWITPKGETSRGRQVATGAGGFSWTPDGQVVYASHASGSKEIWIMNADGSGRKQLTFNNGFSTSPAVSPDGRQIVFASDRAGTLNLWKMRIDGGDPVQLTTGDGENYPRFSSDGRWLIYSSVGNWRLWKMPVGGGKPVQLTDRYSQQGSVSPDGNWLAYFYQDAQPNQQYRIAIMPFTGGSPAQQFELPPQTIYQTPDIYWTPDGRALTYVSTRDGVSNIWTQPLSGGPPKQLTNFQAEKIFYFDLSRDGQQLICSRGGWAHDVVLITSQDHPR